MKTEKERREEAKWFSDLETLKKHHSKFGRNKDGYLIYDTKRSALNYMRVDPKKSERYVDMENEKIRKEKEFAEKNKPIFVEEFLIITYKDNGEEKSRKVNIDKVTEYLMEKYTFKTIFQTKSEDIYFYEDGIYLKTGRKIIQTKVEKILREYSTNH